MSIRMQDIADQLGISLSTVSLALRAAPQVAEETRIRVIDTAEQLGYTVRPRQQRAALSHIAFITRDEVGNDFYGAVLSGAENECRRHDLTMHFVQIGEQVPIRRANYLQVDGLLLVGRIDEPTVDQYQELELPMVLVDNNLPFHQLDRILIENLHSMYRSVQYMYAFGHRSIAFLCGQSVTPSFKERLIGYRAAMTDLGLAPIEFYFQDVDARDVAQTLQQQCRDTLAFSALIGCNDKATVRAFHTLHDHGIRVPDDVSLLGFDDVDLASVVRPALTTNRVPRELLGQLGVQRLIERAREPALPFVSLTLPTTLVERDSVRTWGRE